jgi:hypothetical protein
VVKGAALAAVLLAVPALGAATLFPDAIEQVWANPGKLVSSSPFTFDSPTASRHKTKGLEGAHSRTVARADDATTLTDFRFTTTNQDLANLFALQVGEEFLDAPSNLQPLLFAALAKLTPQWATFSYSDLLAANFVFALLDTDDAKLNLFVFLALVQAVQNPPPPASPHS